MRKYILLLVIVIRPLCINFSSSNVLLSLSTNVLESSMDIMCNSSITRGSNFLSPKRNWRPFSVKTLLSNIHWAMSLEKGDSSWWKIFFFMLSVFHSLFEAFSLPTLILNCTPNHWQDSINPIPVYSITKFIALPPLLQTKHHHFSLFFPEKYRLG